MNKRVAAGSRERLRRPARHRREARAGRTAGYAGFWWEDPARLVLLFILPLYGLLSMSLLGDQKSIARIYFDGYSAFAGGLFLLVLTAAAWFTTTDVQARRGPGDKVAELSPHVLDFVFALALFGYLVMMSGVLAHPAVLLSFFTGTANTFELIELKGRVTGLSTFTQATAPFVALYFYVFRTPVKGFNRYKAYLAVLVVLTLLRSFIFAERLAIIEVALPFALMVVRFRLGRKRLRLLALGPYAAIPLLLGLFIVNEYNRSWETYYINIYDNILDFALERLGLYYSTSLNNGAGILNVLGWGNGHPMFTFDWLLRFPVIGATLQPWLDSGDSVDLFLNSYADPEFNNPSGIFVHFYEWGWFGLLNAAFAGWVFGRGYAGWRRGSGFWCCAHAVIYVSLMEILRIPNLFSGRNFVPMVLLVVVFRWFVKRPERASSAAVRGAAIRHTPDIG
ncbi:oligosaccharide repeat unit polymerase [Burkholderia seminalis]|uniref:oligosaccharide repeat unit polymerase n=1 Tax=Burkholderia seminalis TaxID=488731 RepID=UPI00265182EC|nr:oligosaccharide repeat unit polymerase [Burkholderia seminalis]MDN7588919.1 oligosaccharide repeat unit polymerase [Burkholderia seminalis]